MRRVADPLPSEQELIAGQQSAVYLLAAMETHAGLLENNALRVVERETLTDFFLDVAQQAATLAMRPTFDTWVSKWTALTDVGSDSPFTMADQLKACPMVAAAGGAARSDQVRDFAYSYAAARKLNRDLSRLLTNLTTGYRWNVVSVAAGLSPRQPSTDGGYFGQLTEVLQSSATSEALSEAQHHVDVCKQIAAEMGNPVLSTSAQQLETTFEKRAQPEPTPNPDPERRARRRVSLAPRSVESCIDMAEQYLRAELARLDAVETHRHGLLGESTVRSDYPQGLLIEVLVGRGLEPATTAGALAESIESGGFTYFDAPAFTWPDIDSIGLAARLYSLAEDSAAVERLTQWVTEILLTYREIGQMPVFLPAPGSEKDEPIRALGHDCGAVEAGFLNTAMTLSLSKQGVAAARALAVALFERFELSGPSISVNYIDNFLYRELARLFLRIPTDGEPEPARDRLRSEVGDAVGDVAQSPLSLAMLVLVCSELDMASEAAALVQRLVDLQRHDGAWDASPLYWTMNSAMTATWFRSRALTTALCYDTLRGLVTEQS